MKRKIVMATGGTGGHIFPALSLAFELIEKNKDLEITFAGHGLEGNPYFSGQKFSAHSIPSDALASKNPFELIMGTGRLMSGFFKSRKLLKRFRPDLVIGFGSYHTLPILSSSITARVPLILHEANAIPGKINRLFAPYSAFVGLHFATAKEGLKGTSSEAPLPLRPGYRDSTLSKEEARKHLGLFPQRPTLLVFGGSQGALSLNRLFTEALPLLKRKLPIFQVIHFVGKDPEEKRRVEMLYRSFSLPCFVASFVTDMRYPLAAADLAIVRSGASTMAELSAFSVPALFLPYPKASDNHQEKNGRYVSDVIGGGVVLKESEATAETMASAIEALFKQNKLVSMSNALKAFELRRKDNSFSDQILDFLGG